jgi:hypothetical protein
MQQFLEMQPSGIMKPQEIAIHMLYFTSACGNGRQSPAAMCAIQK